jgi:hypothetical protein
MYANFQKIKYKYLKNKKASSSAGKGVEKLEPSYTASRKVKWCNPFGKQLNLELPYDQQFHS